ncbi:adhesion G-protein coupled receptor G6-like [Lytechinus variegatus]|uniref:adhesion G-protein coupled receptor G6-like n=1 Tax=Lytechinus variegatus TaxID=7654 RepID=UPI001BB10B68|nr:adhesion G-protein coupled receptor G6-like [Lytechinus variegatus]
MTKHTNNCFLSHYSFTVSRVAPFAADNHGREFVFAIPPNYIADLNRPTVGIMVMAASANITSVTVTVPLRNVGFNFSLEPGSAPYDLVLSPDLAGTTGEARITNTTVVVRSDYDVSVSAYNYKAYTMAMFAVIPTKHMGKEYFIATVTQPSGGVVLMSAFDEPTEVSITLTGSVGFDGQWYSPGSVLVYVLKPYETFQLEPLRDDIIGTRITANTSITVTSGGLCSFVPNNNGRCDQIAEQLISFDRWGYSFLLSPFVNRLSGYQYQIVAGRDNTRISLGSHEIVLNMGEHYLGGVTSQIMTSVSASNPVMVMQYSKGTTTDLKQGDPAMLLVTPWEQYVSHVEFPVLDLPAAGISTVYVGVISECNISQNIEFGNYKYTEVPWIIEYDYVTSDNRQICNRWATVEGGSHVFESVSAEETLFTVIVYGVGERLGYLYNAGLSMHPITCIDLSPTQPHQAVEVPCSSLRRRTCPWERTESFYGPLIWSEATENTIVPSDVVCPFNTLRAGQPVAERTCHGNRRKDAYWGEVSVQECGERTAEIQPTDLAKIVVDEANVALVSAVLEEVIGNISTADDEMVGAISKTLENIVAVASPSPEVTTNVVNAVGSLISSLKDSESSSPELAASSSSVVTSVEKQVSLTLQDRDEFMLSAENMIVQAATFDNVAMGNGIEFDGGGEADSMASIRLPSSIFKQAGPSGEGIQSIGTKVRFITFNGDSLFRSVNGSQTSGSVISAAIENMDVQGLTEPVIITFNARDSVGGNNTLNQSRCVYWDFDLRNGVGDWSDAGCNLTDVRGDFVTCSCNHLTNFAVLVDISGQHEVKKDQFYFALDLLSKIGCAVSIASLVLTIIVFLVFKRLRNSRPRRILIHFCVSMLCLYLVFLFGIDFAADIDIACVTVGALLHYFMLATVLWMGVEALNMYVMIVRVFDEEGPCFLTKACVIAWGGPLVAVGVTLGLRMEDYLHKSYCFLTPGLSFYLGLLLPVGLTISFNFIMFFVVIRRLWTANLGGNVPLEKEDKTARYRQLRTRLLNAFSISVLLGLTWVFGFLAIEDATYVFQLIFCVTNSLQGLMVFILFCARQDDVRKSIKPHYSRITGMLPLTGRPSTMTNYSLTSRSPGESDEHGRNPLRTAPLSAGSYTRKMASSSTDEVRMISNSDHISEFHD